MMAARVSHSFRTRLGRMLRRALSLFVAFVGLGAVAAFIYAEAASSPGEAVFRARGCALCHAGSFFDEPLPALRSLQPGQRLLPLVERCLASAHPILTTGQGELVNYLAARQLPALARLHARGEGARLYEAKCAACHGADGLGEPGAYPPLLGSEWLRDSDKLARLPEILTCGLQGPITVKGQPWDATMNAPGLRSEQEKEAVTEYVRGQF